LDAFKLKSGGETGLRALMDYLSKIKEIAKEAQFSPTKEFPDSAKVVEILEKLAKIVKIPNDTVYYVEEFISEPETRQFWEVKFGKSKYSVPWTKFAKVLSEDEFAADAAVLQDLRMYLDHYNTGHVVCHRLSDFVGDSTLLDTLQKYKNARKSAISPIRPDGLKLPLILWIDDHPENNVDLVEYVKDSGVSVIPLQSSANAKQWITRHPEILEVKEANKVRIITDNVRSGANTILDLNAGEDMIRFVRGRRSMVPIMVFCGDLNYAKYVSKYKQCSATNLTSKCQAFIEEMFPQSNIQ